VGAAARAQVLDSPFARLRELMVELAEEQKLPIPRAFMRMALSMMKRSVRRRAGFNIDDVSPLDAAPQAFIPALFGAAASRGRAGRARVLALAAVSRRGGTLVMQADQGKELWKCARMVAASPAWHMNCTARARNVAKRVDNELGQHQKAWLSVI
jgi:hypothetical protein